MIEIFKEIWGNYIVAAAIMLYGMGVLIWKLALRSQATKDKLKEFDTLPCAHHDLRLNSHDSSLTETRATLGEMKGQLDLLVKLSTASRTKPLLLAAEEYSMKKSPRKLNENGEALYNDISGEAFLSDNLPFFVLQIDNLAPKTALDVENFALSVLRVSSSDDIFIPLKSWVYNEPTREIVGRDGEKSFTDVSMDDVLFVLSIPLRDKYLETHDNIIK